MDIPQVKANETQLKRTLKRLRNCYTCPVKSTCRRDAEIIKRKCVPTNIMNAYELIIDYYFDCLREARRALKLFKSEDSP